MRLGSEGHGRHVGGHGVKRAPVVVTAVVLVIAGLVFAVVLLAIDRTPRERVAALTVDAAVDATGDVAITETFTWDFDTATRSQVPAHHPHIAVGRSVRRGARAQRCCVQCHCLSGGDV